MYTRQISVLAREGDPDLAEANLAICSECRSETFYIFQLVSETHTHLQCTKCDTSYCAAFTECDKAPQGIASLKHKRVPS